MYHSEPLIVYFLFYNFIACFIAKDKGDFFEASVFYYHNIS